MVNIRGELVEHEFVSTNLTPEIRREFAVEDRGWRTSDANARWLQEKMLALLGDWGAFLELSLYRDALIHFLGGPQTALQDVELCDGTTSLGTQSFQLVSPTEAFSVTAMTCAIEPYESHLIRLLQHTPLQHLHWINLNHHTIQFTSLTNTSRPGSCST